MHFHLLSKQMQGIFELFAQSPLHPNRLLSPRRLKPKPKTVEGLVIQKFHSASIQGISGQRMAGMGKMHPDLMGSSGPQGNA